MRGKSLMTDAETSRAADQGSGLPLGDPTWERMEDQIAWYDRRSGEAQHWYKRAKVVELLLAATVPPLAGLGASAAVVSILASLVVVLEALQHLFQWNEHW